MSRFSKNIRWLRDKLGVSQQDVATAIRKKKGAYASYEEGRAEPKLDDLIKIADYFHVEIDDLLVNDMTVFSDLSSDFVKSWETKQSKRK